MNIPVITVGIMHASSIRFVLCGNYTLLSTGEEFTGEQLVSLQENKIYFNRQMFDSLELLPQGEENYFELKEVTIGIQFHWERKEDLRFQGDLQFIIAGKEVVAINRIDVESYLESVISSEMNEKASPGLLSAHTVISRSWLLAQLEKRKGISSGKEVKEPCPVTEEREIIRWYDREDHLLYDFCADDHCQRYQGITRIPDPAIREIVRKTSGEVLTDGRLICDTRFSKCCGGVTEKFEYCWEPRSYPYLTTVRDNSSPEIFPDLQKENEAERWILNAPEAFCNTAGQAILKQVLNNYDYETSDFYRWKISYTQEVLAELVCKKSGIDFGEIIDLIPVCRGTSGRIEKLKIKGKKETVIIGKELEIRRILSESHLYSSAFIIKKVFVPNQATPSGFILFGAGWGHGVGLCQIGAAVMAARGYSYKQILQHYLPNTFLNKLY
ncbi:MAG: SpoIID/LytB domain-containing protein [Tannerellaceae bacterium]|nr:SpoIID/LytB domain-containing protein [Tannerellaceae bacterium]